MSRSGGGSGVDRWRRRRSGRRGSEIRIKKAAGKERRQIAGRRNPRKRIRGGGSQAIGGGSARTPSGFAIRNPEVGFKWREEKESHLNGGRDLELRVCGRSGLEQGGGWRIKQGRVEWKLQLLCLLAGVEVEVGWDYGSGMAWPCARGCCLCDAAAAAAASSASSLFLSGREEDGWMDGWPFACSTSTTPSPLSVARCLALPCLASLYLTPHPLSPLSQAVDSFLFRQLVPRRRLMNESINQLFFLPFYQKKNFSFFPTKS